MMKSKTLFLMLGIYIFIFPYTNLNFVGTRVNWCSNYGKRCSPFQKMPCCQKTNECRFVDGYYHCVPKATLKCNCKFNEDCHTIRHATCSSENKCLCKPNYVEVNETACAPLLGEFCKKNEACAANNSVCIDNECQCSNGFIKKAYNKCVPTHLGMSCDNDLTCTSIIKNTVCYKNYGCQCKINYKAIATNACAPVLNAPCFGNETCAIANSMCIDNVCQCKRNFLNQGSRCLTKYLDEPCKENDDCAGINFAICSPNKRCTCHSEYIGVKTMCLPLLGGSCSRNDQCFITNSICIDSTCQCKPGYLISSRGQCVPVSSIKSCHVDADCNDYQHAKCSINKQCVCKSNFPAIEGISCVSMLGDYCMENDQCPIRNSQCIDNKCQCRVDHSEIADNLCILSSLGQSCQSHSNCDDEKNLECSTNKRCVCKENFTTLDYNQCVPVLNGFCTDNNQCIFSGFHCVDNKCQCKPDFIPLSAHQCAETTSVFSCNKDIDCSDSWHAKCVDNKCLCSSNHVAVNNATCYPISGGLCWNDRQCVAENSECIDFHCRCKEDYVALSDSLCAYKKFFL